MAVVYEMETVYQKYKGEKNYANKNISLDIKNNQIVGCIWRS
ncbi:hypothetical protein [Levilactobacillus fuyuanensis]|uniref:ABC transporter ATP-binding protein n=1 Tax=Levilactobacillus fuyuanensis TaxID=2486022 RepID=A0ABW4H5R9_9LACO|nr:hypothetical protein [Levilactobacillus fuyuanensis]